MNNAASYPQQEQLAFDILTKRYRNSNDIRLVQVSNTRSDTIINKISVNDYIIEFTYTKKNILGKLFKSKYDVIYNKANSQYFDMELNNVEQFEIDSLVERSMHDAL
jgi:hypothetical protein